MPRSDDNKRDLEQNQEALRAFVASVHRVYLKDASDIRRCEADTGLKYKSIEAALTGKMGLDTHGLMLCWGFGIDPMKLDNYLPKIRKAFTKLPTISLLDTLITKVLRVYSPDQIIVWLELLLAKAKIEESLGTKKKVGRPKK